MGDTKDDFTSFSSPYFGLCYTINAKNDQIRNGTLLYSTDNGQIGWFEITSSRFSSYDAW